jgi:three-Cys-motif partner protein
VPFTEAHFIETCARCRSALEARLDNQSGSGVLGMPRNAAKVHPGDANEVAAQILGRCHSRAYIFVFADPEGPQDLPWQTVRALKSMGHQSVDLYVLYPVTGINRLLPYEDMEAHANLLDAFFGNRRWLDLVRRLRPTSEQAGIEEALLDLYKEGLKGEGLWESVVDAESAGLGGSRELYRMLYATSNATAGEIASYLARMHRDAGQGTLFT